MSRGLGHLQLLIVTLLDKKAKETDPEGRKTIIAYCRATDIARELQIDVREVDNAMVGILRRNMAKVYPNSQKRDRYFGSARFA